MAGVIGTLGELPFVCSFGKMLTFRDLNRTVAARWAKHELIGRKPLLEFVGPDLNTASLTVRFDMSLGVPPAVGLLRLRKMLENKQYKTLIIGGEYLGRYVIDNISEERKFHNGAGACIIAEATISLVEWAG
jgi:phage protein U